MLITGITEADVRARLYDGATFELRWINWSDLTQGDVKLLNGTVGDIIMEHSQFQTELRGLTQKLTTIVGSVYGQECLAQLFDGGANGVDPHNHWKCQLHRADWFQTGTVQSSPDSITVVPINNPSLGEELLMVGSSTPTALAPSGWFNDGLIKFTSGVLYGYIFEIATWDGVTLTLFAGAPMPEPPSPGDTFEIEPGCDKFKTTCFSKFNNIVNFRGFQDIPGLNVLSGSGKPAVASR